MFVPVMTIVHDYRSRVGFKPHLIRLMVTNLARYFSKWGWVFDRDRGAINRARSPNSTGFATRVLEQGPSPLIAAAPS
jgi:hypothetical protein